MSEKTKQNLATALGIVLLVVVIYTSGIQLLEKLGANRLVQLFSGVFGKELLTDGRGHTNILLLGIGGEGHEGKDLTDTIMIASLDHKNRAVSLLSLPRDLYTESSLGGSRINRLYEQGKPKWGSEQGLDFVRDTIEKIIAVPIQYSVKVDFEATSKIVDAVGGIDVYVEDTINDPFYPKGESYEYETFFLAKGNQHLDGSTALKYVRSRKTSSDFDRSKRQQQVLLALKNKAQEENILSKNQLLNQLYRSMQDHVETNISLREMISLADFAAHWDSRNLAMATLNDEPTYRGGFLYTPVRELYGGAYVLLPASDNFDSLRLFVKLVFEGPKNISELPVAIINGTKQPGFAATARAILNRFGMRFSGVGNAKAQDLAKTTWYFQKPTAEALVTFLQQMIPGEIVNNIPGDYVQDPKFTDAAIVLELGPDARPFVDKLDVFKNVFLMVSPAAANINAAEPATPGTKP